MKLTCTPTLELRFKEPAATLRPLVDPDMQCLAVKMVFSFRMVPPQKWLPYLDLSDTCQGIGLVADVPPTILSNEEAIQAGIAAENRITIQFLMQNYKVIDSYTDI